MKFKKVLSLALAAVMAFSFAACGGSADSKGDDNGADESRGFQLYHRGSC